MSSLAAPVIILNPADDVGVARQKIGKGEATGYDGLVAKDLIGRGHKVALKASMGRTQTIQIRDGVLYGYSDPRNPDGKTLGY